MNETYINIIARELSVGAWQVTNTQTMLSEGATVPFISRYRKERTGNLDEMQIAAIKERTTYFEDLQKRKETVIKTIEEQGKMTDALRQSILSCTDQNILEDIYLPYKPKRKTRASVAIENGLEPLAKILFSQSNTDPHDKAAGFLTEKVPDVDSALQGARDIIAEWVAEDAKARDNIRKLFAREAVITSRVLKSKMEEGIKYKDYFEFSEPLKNCPSHRLLAIRRGENEAILTMDISVEADDAIDRLERIFIKASNDCAEQVSLAIKDSYKRLLKPSIETEFRVLSKEKADEEAIRVFAENLRQLLLSAPLGQKRILAIDPGFRTGCKVVALDEHGTLLHNTTIYPHEPQNQQTAAMAEIRSMVEKFKIEALAVGNGTAGKETEKMVQGIRFDREVQIFMVSENGASVYSASEVAREEFPDHDVTVRGAISIGRRLMDPLSELVKIDPQSIGVGQYQHDVNQKRLRESLDAVVESCVNQVGVNLNTASKHLLHYVSGLGPKLAQSIVDYRTDNGGFRQRKDLLKVPLLGNKAFEQAAGFLRIQGGTNLLDGSAVHPESYHIVEAMARDTGSSVQELIEKKEVRKRVDPKRYLSEAIGAF
ncbi:MAG: helix-hairpin-helix domain-containing protein, partial [Cyclobacteriaceae bacterium]|nr:helix-hairpin-helix domain-containing protein [Cyclobacteriaceae bacterium]